MKCIIILDVVVRTCQLKIQQYLLINVEVCLYDKCEKLFSRVWYVYDCNVVSYITLYISDNIEVKCDFDTVLSKGEMYLYLINRDVYWTSPHPRFPQYSNIGYTYYRIGHETEDLEIEEIFNIERHSCYTKVDVQF
jgi:hypothetical protein